MYCVLMHYTENGNHKNNSEQSFHIKRFSQHPFKSIDKTLNLLTQTKEKLVCVKILCVYFRKITRLSNFICEHVQIFTSRFLFLLEFIT